MSAQRRHAVAIVDAFGGAGLCGGSRCNRAGHGGRPGESEPGDADRRMRNRSTLSQFLTLAVLLLHLGVMGVVPVADAILSRIVPPSATVHIESDHDAPGSPGHNHVVCQLCRLSGLDLWAAPPVTAPAATSDTTIGAAPPPSHAPHDSTLRSALRPRAPPLA